ncbi:Polysaccharide pyruvyl transferase [Caballeronia fortuita]|uniref:Polysaccharide pyruvyl transferase n=1 Tax=Caballeronia fortuita TaxID=1777138 RepID=A0A158C5A9_9BURK|nr:polysaccharide pyruvyl transferase family protein [Caballeronia fortuita]SAK77493.1 Polysaccharide pyruvyl transferase [Caballeronia fortuita]
MGSERRIIVFGAFDRHNFGDMLFAHVVAALLEQRCPGIAPIFAGCAQRDLRAYGGHDVAALAPLAARWRDEPLALIHAGGELLTCGAWEAAVMLTKPEEAQARIARYGSRAQDRDAWARTELATGARAPYVIGRETFPQASICANAIGGAALDHSDAALRAEVLAKLRSADHVSVRDTHTRAALRQSGLDAQLVPDPASMVAELFDARIRMHAGARRAFAHGYLAVQLSADFGDDATLAQIAHRLDRIGRSTGLGIALFRAGAAPWHDDIAVYERMAARMRHPAVTIVDSLNVWDICALIASSEGFAGSSLHGRIVAMAYGLPRVNLHHADSVKQRAYVSTWDIAGAPGVVAIADLHDAMLDALSMDREVLKEKAAAFAKAHREGFEPIARCAELAVKR